MWAKKIDNREPKEKYSAGSRRVNELATSWLPNSNLWNSKQIALFGVYTPRRRLTTHTINHFFWSVFTRVCYVLWNFYCFLLPFLVFFFWLELLQLIVNDIIDRETTNKTTLHKYIVDCMSLIVYIYYVNYLLSLKKSADYVALDLLNAHEIQKIRYLKRLKSSSSSSTQTSVYLHAFLALALCLRRRAARRWWNQEALTESIKNSWINWK